MVTQQEYQIEEATKSGRAVVSQPQAGMPHGTHQNPIWVREVGAAEIIAIASNPIYKIWEMSGVEVEDDCHVNFTANYNYQSGLRSYDDWRAVVSGVKGLNHIQITGMQAGLTPSRVSQM